MRIFSDTDLLSRTGNYLSHLWMRGSGGAAGAACMGQIGVGKIPLSRMISPQLYWVMSDSEFTLDTQQQSQKSQNPLRGQQSRQSNIYGAALGLYNSRIVTQQQEGDVEVVGHQRRAAGRYTSRGLGERIRLPPHEATRLPCVWAFRISVRLVRDYGDKEAKVVNTVEQHFLRSGGRRNCQDALRAVW